MENLISIIKGFYNHKEEFRVYVNHNLYKVCDSLDEAEEFAEEFKFRYPSPGENYTVEYELD